MESATAMIRACHRKQRYDFCVHDARVLPFTLHSATAAAADADADAGRFHPSEADRWAWYGTLGTLTRMTVNVPLAYFATPRQRHRHCHDQAGIWDFLACNMVDLEEVCWRFERG